MTKTCSKCGVEKPHDDFYAEPRCRGDGRRSRCIACSAAEYVARKTAHPERLERQRRNSALRRFGLNVEQYESLLRSQQGRCATCLRAPAGDRSLAVDHDHATGKVRGLLCMPCNRMLVGRKRGVDGAELLGRASRYLMNPPAGDVLGPDHRVSERRPNGRRWEDV